MILSMPQQTLLFVTTVGVGAGVGLFYDMFRVLRLTAPHGQLAVQIEDFVFWVAATGMVFYVMLHLSEGEIRWFSLVGTSLGMALYFATVSRWVVAVAVIIVNFAKRVLTATVRVLMLPVRILLVWVTPPAATLAKNIRRHLHKLGRYGKIKLRKNSRNWNIMRTKK